ncbi:MAG: sorbosone dehydrogenase [Phycisphaeraceae bacterium]|nr:MAG: sorbosone dehydrogenase [Phycisphaeraceae bacterium]
MLSTVLALGGVSLGAHAQPSGPDARITVRDGFELTVAAKIDGRARFMAVADDGTLYVTDPDAGIIRALRDENADGGYERQDIFLEGLPRVHGIAFHDGWVWFTQTGSIHRARDVDSDGDADDRRTILAEGTIPAGAGHWWRSICIHGGRLYTSIGDSGNITDEADSERQKIWSFDLRGGDKTLFASGVRNTEKLVIRPGTDELWGMDHGSDWFGRAVGDRRHNQPITDLNPPDEMNHYVAGGFYGHPYITGNRVPRYEYLDRDDIHDLAARTTPPEWATGAHWAPNAMCFYAPPAGARAALPAEYAGDALVAYHGSWNRSRRSGYQVTRVLFEDGHPYGELSMVEFLAGDDADEPVILGRPVDVVVDRDGSVLISEDGQNTIYRLRWADGES